MSCLCKNLSLGQIGHFRILPVEIAHHRLLATGRRNPTLDLTQRSWISLRSWRPRFFAQSVKMSLGVAIGTKKK